MTSMNFLTLSYNCVTISFLPEIWFWGPTHPTFLYDVTLFSLFLDPKDLMKWLCPSLPPSLPPSVTTIFEIVKFTSNKVCVFDVVQMTSFCTTF